MTEDDYNAYFKDYGYSADAIGRRGTWWWLRSPGDLSSIACSVFDGGGAGWIYSDDVGRGDGGVRPAMYVEW